MNKALSIEPELLIAVLTKAVVLEAALSFDDALAWFSRAACECLLIL